MTQVTFEELVAAHRRELPVHCYRLLGSVTDAEDVLKDRGYADLDHWIGRRPSGVCR